MYRWQILTTHSSYLLLFLASISVLLFRAFSFKKKECLFILTGAEVLIQEHSQLRSLLPKKWFFSAPDCRLPTGSIRDGSGQQMWLVQPEQSVIKVKLSRSVEHTSLSYPCLHDSLRYYSPSLNLVTPLSGPLGIWVCNPCFRLWK